MSEFWHVVLEGTIGFLIVVLLWVVGRLRTLLQDVQSGLSLQIAGVRKDLESIKLAVEYLTAPAPRISDPVPPIDRKK